MPPRSCSAGRFWRCPSWDSPRLLSTFAVALREGVGRRVCGPDECQCSIDGETAMEVILLERVAKLGQMGDVVRVKDGFARNFLLPQGKALRATKDSRVKFETMRSQLEARNLELKSDAEKVGAKLDGQSFIVIRQASETGQLYGSVSPRDIIAILNEGGFAVARGQISLNTPIKAIG